MSTSLHFFPEVASKSDVPPEWGTGKHTWDKPNIWTPVRPTWQLRGEPIKQYYDVTMIKKSNVRQNDELVPKPQESDMGKLLIDRPFPGEHPYTSHMSQKAVFPTFDSPEDPQRGVHARSKQPIPAEMPANAYDVTIVNKAMGSGLRQEIQAFPFEGHKRALTWNGENNFDQIVKSHGHRQDYYPIPIKTLVPNLQHRRSDMMVSQRTANALRNVERDQWQTTYDLSHTGLGSSNPMKLDNMDDKMERLTRTGQMDDSLTPRSYRTYDPPRPQEGRLARRLVPKPPPMKTEDDTTNNGYIRRMTKSEIEEHRLWNGREYVSLPDPSWPDTKGTFKHQGAQWMELNDRFHAEPSLDKLAQAKQKKPAEPIPYDPVMSGPTEKEGSYLTKLRGEQKERIQQVEAQNRWKDLEMGTPNHDITQLNHKYKKVNYQEDHPASFYNHEGKYQGERAGMYKTSYDPYMLEYQMNKDGKNGASIMNSLHSHEDALRLPMQLNNDMDQAMLNSKTNPREGPMFSDRPPARDILEPYQYNTEIQRRILQPTSERVGVKTQEKETILLESTTQSSYNVPKFLQENNLPDYSRNEPLALMSKENKVLGDVRENSSPKRVQFNKNVTVAEGAGREPLTLKSASIEKPREEFPWPEMIPTTNVTTTQYSSAHAQYTSKPETTQTTNIVSKGIASLFDTSPKAHVETQSMKFSTLQKQQRDPLVTDAFSSLSTNFLPAGMENSMAYKTSSQTQFPNYDLSYKMDDRFDWTVGSGLPRPQTKLLKIQNSFSRTTAHRKFHNSFIENNPDIRDNTVNVHDKKHKFGELTAQEIHG